MLRRAEVGDFEPKRPHHYQRQVWIGSAIRKKMATWASLSRRAKSNAPVCPCLAKSGIEITCSRHLADRSVLRCNE